MRSKYKYILAILIIGMAAMGALAVANEIRDGKYTGPWVKVKDNVEIKARLPDVPKEIPILKVDNKNIDQGRSKGIAESILEVKNLGEIKSDNTRAAISVKDNNETEITVYKKGQLKYFTGKQWDEMYKKEDLPSDKQAKDISAKIVKKLIDEDLLNKDTVDVTKSEVTNDETCRAPVEQPDKVECFASNKHVNVDLSYKGIPLYGAGAKVRIYLGKNGELLGLLNSVGKVVPDKKVSIITPKDAIDKLKDKGYRDITIDSIRLVYDVKSPEEGVDYAEPAYDIQGKQHTTEEDVSFAIMIPATK